MRLKLSNTVISDSDKQFHSFHRSTNRFPVYRAQGGVYFEGVMLLIVFNNNWLSKLIFKHLKKTFSSQTNQTIIELQHPEETFKLVQTRVSCSLWFVQKKTPRFVRSYCRPLRADQSIKPTRVGLHFWRKREIKSAWSTSLRPRNHAIKTIFHFKTVWVECAFWNWWFWIGFVVWLFDALKYLRVNITSDFSSAFFQNIKEDEREFEH